MELEEKKLVRGRILRFLDGTGIVDGEQPMAGAELLQRYLAAARYRLTITAVEKELSYLEGKRLVELERLTGRAAQIAGGSLGARITSAGRDIVEGTTSDPGIDMGPFAG